MYRSTGANSVYVLDPFPTGQTVAPPPLHAPSARAQSSEPHRPQPVADTTLRSAATVPRSLATAPLLKPYQDEVRDGGRGGGIGFPPARTSEHGQRLSRATLPLARSQTGELFPTPGCPLPVASSRWRSLRRSDCLQRREIGSEYEGEQRHADVHAILHFNKVGRARVSIHVG